MSKSDDKQIKRIMKELDDLVERTRNEGKDVERPGMSDDRKKARRGRGPLTERVRILTTPQGRSLACD